MHSLQGNIILSSTQKPVCNGKVTIRRKAIWGQTERARCGEAQQSLRRGWKGRRAACAEPQEQKFQQSCSAPRSAQPRWGLCSGLAGAHLLVCCAHLGWLCVSRCECFPLHLDHGMVAVSSLPHHSCCCEMEERDPQNVYKIFNSLWSPKGQCKWEDLMPGKSKALRLVPGTGQGNESIRHWLAARGVQQAPRIWHTAH